MCKQSFTPTVSTLQVTCTKVSCVLQHAKIVKAKENKKKIKEMREKLKTSQDYRKELQIVFNSYIRARDRDAGCISCGKKLGSKFDAGHYFSVGNYPNLRYDETNVHGQCVTCNQHLHGNLIEYGARLPERIGQAAFDRLHELKVGRLSLTIPELQDQIKHYKQKLKHT
jgi:hypothetical protein